MLFDKEEEEAKESTWKKHIDNKDTYLVEASAVAAKFRLRATAARIGTLTAVNPVEAWRADDEWMWNSHKYTPYQIRNIFE